MVEYNQLAAKADMDSSAGVGGISLATGASTADYLKFEQLSAPPAHTTDIASRKAVLLSKWRGRLKWVPKEVKVYRQLLVRSVKEGK